MSFATTVVENALPAVWGFAAVVVTAKWWVAAATTVMDPLVPLIPAVTVSVAVTVRLPADFSVTPPVKVWVPLSPAPKAKSFGRTACASLEVKWTVPV